MKTLMIVILMVLAISGEAAMARCKRAEVAGTWYIYFGVSTAAVRCTLKVPRSGPTVGTGSYCLIPGLTGPIPLSGNLLLAANCHVAGQLAINGIQSPIDGWISRDKENISGMSWDPVNAVGGIFSGVKL